MKYNYASVSPIHIALSFLCQGRNDVLRNHRYVTDCCKIPHSKHLYIDKGQPAVVS